LIYVFSQFREKQSTGSDARKAFITGRITYPTAKKSVEYATDKEEKVGGDHIETYSTGLQKQSQRGKAEANNAQEYKGINSSYALGHSHRSFLCTLLDS